MVLKYRIDNVNIYIDQIPFHVFDVYLTNRHTSKYCDHTQLVRIKLTYITNESINPTAVNTFVLIGFIFNQKNSFAIHVNLKV